ncbi:MAG: hypothetical protein ACLUTA_02755 [Blautia wexlerae]
MRNGDVRLHNSIQQMLLGGQLLKGWIIDENGVLSTLQVIVFGIRMKTIL